MLRLLPSVSVSIVLCSAVTALGQDCPGQWESGMGVPGLDGSVAIMKKWDPDGPGPLQPVIVMGGNFNIAGDTFASHVVTWDGSAFQALGSGVSGYVGALEIDNDNNLIVGGGFTVAGGGVARYVARWNGSTWSEVGGGTDGLVTGIAKNAAGQLVIGGHFTHAGGTSCLHVAKLNGAAWESMGTGIPGNVAGLARGPANSVVAIASGTSSAIDRVWSWNGTAWANITNAVIRTLTSVATHSSGDALLSGEFTNGSRIQRWDGTTYSGMGIVSSNNVSRVQVLDDGDIYAVRTQTTTINGVAQYVNNNWVEVAHIVSSSPQVVEKLNGSLMVGGSLHEFENGSYWNYFRYQDDGNWVAPRTGFDFNHVQALLETSDHSLVASGYFTAINGISCTRIAKFDGTTWSPLGAGLNELARAIVQMPDGSIVAGGDFTASGGSARSKIARWDGASWLSMGPTFNGPVTALAVGLDGTLYAGGGFPGLIGGARVMRWNGTSSWSPVGSGITEAAVGALCIMPNGALIAGGNFSASGGSPGNYVASWNGTTWSPLGAGCNAEVRCAVVSPSGDLFVGGLFSSAGGVPAQGVARWSGSWSAVGGGLFGGEINELTLSANQELYAAGTFQTTPGRIVRSIARFDGLQWRPMGEGLSDSADVVAVHSVAALSNGRIAAGGRFSNSGTILSRSLAFFDPGVAPEIAVQPVDFDACVQHMAEFHVAASSSSPLAYRWQKNGADISLAANPSAASDTLHLDNLTFADIGRYSCRVSNECRFTITRSAQLGVCAADFNCDSGVDIFDYLDFVAAFADGQSGAEINGDGTVDFFDYLDFVDSFSRGC